MLSATIGGRARAVLTHDAAPRVVSPAAVGDEVLEHLPGIARKRMRSRDEDDWPVVAAALHLLRKRRKVAIWTQDRDIEVSRIATLTTGDILDQLERR